VAASEAIIWAVRGMDAKGFLPPKIPARKAARLRDRNLSPAAIGDSPRTFWK
jgi:hypothetical protein